LPLRLLKLWAGVAWLLTAGVVVGSLLPGEAISGFAVRDKLLHAGAYFLLMISFAGHYRPALYPAIAIALLALGLGLDLLQLLTATRSFDWYDVAANGMGVAVGLALSSGLLGGWCQHIERRLLS